jgi:hypothetical protein
MPWAAFWLMKCFHPTTEGASLRSEKHLAVLFFSCLRAHKAAPFARLFMSLLADTIEPGSRLGCRLLDKLRKRRHFYFEQQPL